MAVMHPDGVQHFHLERNLLENNYSLYFALYFQDGKVSVPRSLEVETVELKEGDLVPYKEPLIKLQKDSAQELLDELWRAGLRPSNVKSLDGQIEAMQHHIDDLRWIVKAHIVGESND